MNDAGVLVAVSGATAVVTLNRPDQRNALTSDVKTLLLAAVTEVAQDKRIRAVVLAANGPAFCVGQDLGEHAVALTDGPDAAFATVRNHYSPIVKAILTMPKPVIASVSGACVGAGLGLALACDYRVFGPGVKLATAFGGIGLTFDSGLSVTLPRAVGTARAAELMLFGRSFSAEDAIAWGVSGETVESGADSDAVLRRALELADQLAKGPTRAFAETRELLRNAQSLTLDEALEVEAAAQARCGATQDHAGAVKSFLERLPPSFAGE